MYYFFIILDTQFFIKLEKRHVRVILTPKRQVWKTSLGSFGPKILEKNLILPKIWPHHFLSLSDILTYAKS